MTAPLERTLARIAAEHAPAALANRLSAEDMVLTDAIARLRLPIDLFVLDTGRLHADTLELIDIIRERYGVKVQVYQPRTMAVQAYVQVHGRDAFYQSLELRRSCCDIRKVEPLKRARARKRAGSTRPRRGQ
jgi:phosphoadenosine phosphosulfate reductase